MYIVILYRAKSRALYCNYKNSHEIAAENPSRMILFTPMLFFCYSFRVHQLDFHFDYKNKTVLSLKSCIDTVIGKNFARNTFLNRYRLSSS